MAWAAEWAKEGKEVDWQKLLPPRGFQVLPRRWVVERSFAWICHNRRMSKDYERLRASGEAFVYAAMTRLMVSGWRAPEASLHSPRQPFTVNSEQGAPGLRAVTRVSTLW
jgi:hypothetical protein